MAAKPKKEVDTSTYTGKFAVRLTMLRKKAGLSVEELSAKSGISDKTLYTWENATRSPINEDLPKLANALGVKTRTLLPDE